MGFSTRLSVFVVLLFAFIFTFAYAATFEIRNECPYTVWAASTPGGGRRLDRGQTWSISVNPGTKLARIWGRTNCNFDGSGRGMCETGDCGGLLQCQGSGKPPNTLAEYALNQFNNLDFFDISNVVGFNIPIEFGPTRAPTNTCRTIKCTADIKGQCPALLRAPGGCNNPCTTFKTPEYCCSTAGRCNDTAYSRFFKERCPDAYSYPKDDQTSTFTCPGGTNYRVVFCPNGDHYHDSCAYNQSQCVGLTPPECRRVDNDFVRKKGYMNGKPYRNEGDSSITLEECQHKCVTNCSCFAYASVHDNGTGCQLWNRGIEFTEVRGGSTYIHMLATLRSTGKKRRIWFIIAIPAAVVIILFITSCYLIWRKLRQRGEEARQRRRLLLELGAHTTADKFMNTNETGNADKKGPDVKIFSFSSILAATDNFSPENKLGQGGFGPVYKGKLLNGQEIAVKRLSRSSGQGLVEFKNEIVVIAKLQHMNLVRLLGYCIEGEEKMLIYEYMPNKSLDFFLFDPVRKELLDWKRRLSIIEGIAQGLLYLHKYSRLRVIHRDLKAGNVLLDNDMNPKISDFGLARIFEQNESQANTNRPAGTYGYMSPEYVMEGTFSMKSDVYSFGVLLLEIMSGRKNSSFYHFERPTNLIGYTWELWREGKTSELLDPSLVASCQQNEPLRLIHIGLLCVQGYASDRPSMSDVVSMLTNVTIPLPPPKQPAFLAGRSMTQADTANRKTEKCSINGVSLSTMDPR